MSGSREARLVQVPLDDARETLAGAWIPPAGDGAEGALLHLHGKGGNFYSGPALFIPAHDEAGECAHLSLNMRCHDLGYTRYDAAMPDVRDGDPAVAGGMWERIEDGLADVSAGVRWLRGRGHERVFVVGHSSGGYYGLQACAERVDGLAGLVLLSTLISHRRHLGRWFPGGRAGAAVDHARKLLERGEGHRLILTEGWYHAISAASLVEREAEPDGIVDSMLAACEVPVMFVAGEREPRVPDWRALHDAMPATEKEWFVLPGASHDYHGYERELTDRVLEFVRRWA